jgi:hypothetical protein
VLDGNMTRYSEGEVEYVLDMIKNAYNDFKRTDVMRPFYMKAMETLKFLLSEQKIDPIFDRVQEEYAEITLENTMKLLIRCKMAFSSRTLLITMFELITQYDEHMDILRSLVETKETYRVLQEDLEKIQKTT